jgi:hypothetical protein
MEGSSRPVLRSLFSLLRVAKQSGLVRFLMGSFLVKESVLGSEKCFK